MQELREKCEALEAAMVEAKQKVERMLNEHSVIFEELQANYTSKRAALDLHRASIVDHAINSLKDEGKIKPWAW
eukprot:gene16873-23145_t